MASQRRYLEGKGGGGRFCVPNSSGKTVDLASTMKQSRAPTGAIACDQPLLSFLPEPGSKRFSLYLSTAVWEGEAGCT